MADPNYAPMYANRSRRTKTDKRDAHTLMVACEKGTYRPAHRLADGPRHVRAELAVRDAIVRTGSRYASLAKALVRRDGLRVPSSDSLIVPNKRQVMTRYYGWYANRPRGTRRKRSAAEGPSAVPVVVEREVVPLTEARRRWAELLRRI